MIKTMKRNLSILLIIFSISTCIGQNRAIEKIDFSTEYLFSSEIEEKVATDTVPWKHQNSATSYADKGDYKNALRHWDLATGTRERTFSETQVNSLNKKYSIVKATDYIIEQAKYHQVVIINEAHHNSFHRVFTKSLLQKLFDQGYKNLGLEALSNGENLDSLLNPRKYPVQETGHYIKDPQFGNLVREALEIGYSVFPYETTKGEGGKQREIEQAKNIQKVINSKPNEKFLIHSGSDHALEGNHELWEKAMAARLTEYTGIDPLTINQEAYTEKSHPNYNHPLLKAFDIKESTVLIDKDNNPLKYIQGEGWTDIAVLHPNTEYINDRPNWLFKGDNRNVSIDLTDMEIEYPVMVLAFEKGEDIKLAIPVDVTEVDTKTESCNLGLKSGIYEILVTDGKESFTFDLDVK